MGQQLYSRSNPVPVQPYPGLPYPGQEPNPQQQLYRSYSVQPIIIRNLMLNNII